MATIGSLAINILANTAGFSAGVGMAERQLKRFAGQAKGVSAGAGLADLALPLLAFGAAAGAATSAVSSLVHGLTGLVQSGIANIVQTTRSAERLGVTTEAMGAMAKVAQRTGIATEEMSSTLFHFQRQLGAAANGSHLLAAKFAVLGLDARKLANLPLDQSLQQIAVAFQRIHSPAERAAFLMEMFGRGGRDMGRLLEGLAGGLEGASREAEKTGELLNKIDSDKVMAAHLALERVQSVIVGIGNRLAVGLAPQIERVAKLFFDWATSGEGVAGKVADAISSVGDATATVLDGLLQFSELCWQYLHAPFFRWGAFVADTAATVLNVVGQVLDGIAQFADDASALWQRVVTAIADSQLGQWGLRFVQTLMLVRDAIGEVAGWVNQHLVQPILDGIQRVVNYLAGTAQKLAEKLPGPVANRFSGLAASLHEMANGTREFAGKPVAMAEDLRSRLDGLRGAFCDIAAGARGMGKEIEGAAERASNGIGKTNKRLEQLLAQMYELQDEPANDLEKFQEKLGVFQKAFSDGILDEEHFLRGLEGTVDAFEKSVGIGASKLPQALEAGSSAAVSAITKAGQANTQADPVAKLQEAIKAQELIQRNQLEVAKQIRDAIARGQIKVVGNGDF